MKNGYKAKVDLAGEIDKKIKELNEKLKVLKDELKEIAEKKGKKSLSGNIYTAIFSPSTTTKIESRDLLKLLRKQGKEKKFVDLVKVDITATKRYLNTNEISKIADVQVKEYNRVQFVEK